MTADNSFNTYVSTADDSSDPLDLFLSGNNWETTYTGSTSPLAAGQDYYLLIEASDAGGIAGMIGHFTLDGTDHEFYDGSQHIQTNSDWVGNNSGFNGSYTGANNLGNNGVGPWGFRSGISSNAHWLWMGDPYNNNGSYFAMKISATSSVPAPAPLIIFGRGLLIVSAKRRFR